MTSLSDIDIENQGVDALGSVGDTIWRESDGTAFTIVDRHIRDMRVVLEVRAQPSDEEGPEVITVDHLNADDFTTVDSDGLDAHERALVNDGPWSSW